MAKPFSVDIAGERHDGLALVVVHVELDIATVERFELALRSALAAEPEMLVVDLRDLEFLDSTGLRAILEADQKATREGLRLALVRGPRAVHRVFELTRVDGQLLIVADPSELVPATAQPD